MRTEIQREILTVVRCAEGWAVEDKAGRFGQSNDKDITRASAYRRAREIIDSGRGCQVRIHGEGFFAPAS